MGVDIEDTWHPSIKLNAIGRAIDRNATDPIPTGVTRDDIEEICYTIEQLYGKFIDELVAETELSRRESQSWVLRNLVYEGAEPLSYEAIGLYIWAIGRAREGDPLSRTIVNEYHGRAVEKIDRAEATVMRTGPPPYPDELFDDPTLLWVDSSVGERLRRRLGPEENFSDLLDRLLDETSSTPSLEAVIEAYKTERGSSYVAVDTVYPDWDGNLRLVVHTPEPGDLPDEIAEIEDVRIDDTRVDVTIMENDERSRAASHLVVYRAGEDEEDAVVPLENGIEGLLTALEHAECTPAELVALVREDGGVALAIDETPTGAGAHLYPIYDADVTPQPGPLQYVERITLDDRTIRVTEVTSATTDDIGAMDAELVFLWADAATDGIETRDLPEDPVEQREMFPKQVLWTA